MTFDVWHTLMYLTPTEEEEYYHTQISLAVEALREAPLLPGAPNLPDEELGRVFEQVLAEAVAEAGRGRSITPSAQILRAGAETRRVPRSEEYLARLSSAVVHQPFKPAPGAAALLKELRAEGYRIGIVGNTVGETGASLRKVLESLDLASPVENFMFSDEHPWAKPAPEIFWLALKLLGESPDRAVHVGDARSDIEGARRAGMRTSILFTGLQNYGLHYHALNVGSGSDQFGAQYVVQELREVATVIHELLPIG